MRLINIEQLRAGMIAARTIYGNEGQKLIIEGTELKPHYKKHLKRLGINRLYIQDNRLEGVEVEEVISEATRTESRLAIKDLLTSAKNSSRKKFTCDVEKKITANITNILDELLEQKDLVLNFADIKSTDSYFLDHSLNVTVYSMIMALKMGYTPQKLKKLAPGLLLHDIGNLKVPEYIFKKNDGLTGDEYNEIKKHPEYGYEIYKKSPLFSEEGGKIITQHHERVKGQGYPDGLQEKDIHFMAQVAAIADTYDAMLSERSYRQAHLPHQALEIMTAMGGTDFNLEALACFFTFAAAYPVGTHVLLSNGESGLVVNNHAGFPFRPKVRVLYSGNKLDRHPDPYEMDLVEKLDVVVDGVINE